MLVLLSTISRRHWCHWLDTKLGFRTLTLMPLFPHMLCLGCLKTLFVHIVFIIIISLVTASTNLYFLVLLFPFYSFSSPLFLSSYRLVTLENSPAITPELLRIFQNMSALLGKFVWIVCMVMFFPLNSVRIVTQILLQFQIYLIYHRISKWLCCIFACTMFNWWVRIFYPNETIKTSYGLRLLTLIRLLLLHLITPNYNLFHDLDWM